MPAPPGPSRTIAAIIAEVARRHPARVAIATMDDSVTYAKLHELTVLFAARMRHHGVDRTSCVDLDIEHPTLAIALSVACTLLGCRWTRQVISNPAIHVTHVLHDGAPRTRPGDQVLAVDASWSRPMPGRKTAALKDFDGYRAPTDTWTIMHSSGTTGTPKFMALDEQTVVRRARVSLHPDPPPHPVLACLFPPLSMLGIQLWLAILSRAGTVVFADLLEFFGRVQVDFVLGAPNHFLRFLDQAPPTPRRAAIAIVGGAPASELFFAKMLTHFTAVDYIYGANESSILTSHFITDTAHLDDPVHVGRTLADVTIQIVTEDGTELPSGQEGAIRIRTPWQVTGYIGDPATSAQIFRDDWFYPGDLGIRLAGGELCITGRVNDQLNIGGTKLNPKTIDDAILACPGIKDAACFAIPNANGINLLAAAIATTGPIQPVTLVRQMVQRLRADPRVHQIPQNFYFLSALPRNPTGKISRRDLVDAVRDVPPIDMAA